jgi:hypothetical protein
MFCFLTTFAKKKLFEETFIKNRRRKSFEEQREIVEQSTKNLGNNNDLSTGKGVTFFKRKKKTKFEKNAK